MSVSDANAKPTDITGMYGIRRDPSGWRVNIKRRDVNYFKRFAFSIYGGEASALLRAQAWRDGSRARQIDFRGKSGRFSE